VTGRITMPGRHFGEGEEIGIFTDASWWLFPSGWGKIPAGASGIRDPFCLIAQHTGCTIRDPSPRIWTFYVVKRETSSCAVLQRLIRLWRLQRDTADQCECGCVWCLCAYGEKAADTGVPGAIAGFL